MIPAADSIALILPGWGALGLFCFTRPLALRSFCPDVVIFFQYRIFWAHHFLQKCVIINIINKFVFLEPTTGFVSRSKLIILCQKMSYIIQFRSNGVLKCVHIFINTHILTSLKPWPPACFQLSSHGLRHVSSFQAMASGMLLQLLLRNLCYDVI